MPSHLLEDPFTRDRQHHHAGRRVFACDLVDGKTERVTEDQLLERDARAEPERARAQASDRPRRDFEHGDAITVDPEFGVDGPVGEPDRVRRPPGEERDALLQVGGQSRRCDVDRLFEVRADERVGLVEDREDLELLLAAEQPFDRDLDTREVLLHEQRPLGDGADAFGGVDGRHRVVDANHATTGRQADRLQHARVADVAGHFRDLLEILDHPKPGLGHVVACQGVAHDRLVACGGDGRRWVVGEAESLGGGGGDLHALVVDRDDGVERRAPVERGDRLDRGAGVGQRDDQRPGAHVVGHRLAFLGSDDHLDPEAGGGPHEVGGPVGRGRKQEENAWHGPIMVA